MTEGLEAFSSVFPCCGWAEQRPVVSPCAVSHAGVTVNTFTPRNIDHNYLCDGMGFQTPSKGAICHNSRCLRPDGAVRVSAPPFKSPQIFVCLCEDGYKLTNVDPLPRHTFLVEDKLSAEWGHLDLTARHTIAPSAGT